MKLRELFLREEVININQIEAFADRVFAKVGIDVNFTRHFIDRLRTRDAMITSAELTRLFKQEAKRWGKPIAQMGPEAQGVMKDLKTDVNVPFVLQWDDTNQELDLIAKTVMKKPNFHTPNKVFAIEQLDVTETATAGGTGAGAVATVANPGAKSKKQKKNKNGTAKNALDTGDNLMGGGKIKR